MGKKKLIPAATEVEEMDRGEAYTPGWNEKLDLVESLPIKTAGGKVVRTLKVRTDKSDEIDEVEDENGASEEVGTDGEQDEDEEEEEKEDYSSMATKTSPSLDPSLMEKDVKLSLIKVEIADICSAIQANPQACLSRDKDEDDQSILKHRKIFELFRLLEDHPNMHVQELAMLSAVLLFKDICPGYFIRTQKEVAEVVLKKETKKLIDYEKYLLKAYQRYLRFLTKSVAFLGNIKHDIVSWTAEEKFGLSALRCVCELLRALPFFNFRSQLLQMIVMRGVQPCLNVSNICTETLVHLFKHDVEGEATYETVRLIATTLLSLKYQVPSGFLQCLEAVKLNVHADAAKEVRSKVKKEKRKRKRATDDVLDGLAEADVATDKLNSQRFQADSLHEICLIYFRVIKMKVGFELLPVALTGLGRISHLINVETVEDLVILMRSILESTALSVDSTVRLLCIHCALKTLSGPGEILNYDSEVFITAMLEVLQELFGDFPRWDIVIECIDLVLLKRRELRNNVVLAFVRQLFLHLGHVSHSTASAMLCFINTVLLRYPRARATVEAIGHEEGSRRGREEEPEVMDLAMVPLQSSSRSVLQCDEDGSWMASLLRHHVESKVRTVLSKVLGKNIVNALPYRVAEVNFDPESGIDRLDALFLGIPATMNSKKCIPAYGKPQSTSKAKMSSSSKGKQTENKPRKKAGKWKGGKMMKGSASKNKA